MNEPCEFRFDLGTRTSWFGLVMALSMLHIWPSLAVGQPLQAIPLDDPNPAGEPAESGQYMWAEGVRVGYDRGFVLAARNATDLEFADSPFHLRINGWGQLRQTIFESGGANQDLHQFQLKRARMIASGSAFTPDFSYYIQLDGRSSSGDGVRLLDYYLTYDLGHHIWDWEKGRLGLKTGKYKMPFTMARWLSGQQLEFADRSVASTFFDVNRSLAVGVYGKTTGWQVPVNWEAAIFNGLVTGGAETGSSGTLDNNFAYSARVHCFPTGDWGDSEMADLECHDSFASRFGAAVANTAVRRFGSSEFNSFRVADSGNQLSSLLPGSVDEFNVNMYSIDASCKYRGWSATSEYYFRNIGSFLGAPIGELFDHGCWLQLGKFVVPKKFQLMARWSRVVGNSGTLGMDNQSSDEVAGGFIWYMKDQHARFTLDATYLNGAPVDSLALDISPGDLGWLIRSQLQFSF